MNGKTYKSTVSSNGSSSLLSPAKIDGSISALPRTCPPHRRVRVGKNTFTAHVGAVT